MKLLHSILVGFFLFSILSVEATNFYCDQALILTCGATIQDTVTGNEPLSGVPDYYGGIDSLPTSWMKIAGTGEVMRITLSGSYLYISVLEGSCEGLTHLNSSFTNTYNYSFQTEVGKTYYFAFSRTYEATFTVEVACGVPPVNDLCENAQTLTLITDQNILINANSRFATRDTNCGQIVAGIWYDFIGNGDNVFIKNSGTPLKVQLREGHCEDVFCFINQNLYTNQSTPHFNSTEGQPYRLFVSNLGSIDTAITFELSALAIAENDSCGGAIIISCDTIITHNDRTATPEEPYGETSLWYRFSSTEDQVLTFTQLNNPFYFKVLEGLCEDLTESFCIDYVYQETKILLLANVDYFFQVYTINQGSLLSFEVSCSDPLLNDQCSGASPIIPNQPVLADISSSSITGISTCTNKLAPGLWYSFEGTGKFHVFRTDSYHDIFRMQILSGSCGSLDCIASYDMDTYQPIQFLSQEGLTYRVFIQPRYSTYTPGYIQFRMRLHDLPANDSCHAAIELQPDFAYLQDLTYATPDQNQCSDLPGVWYKINGNDSIVQINNFGSSHDVHIMRGTCDQLECITGHVNGSFDNYRFYAQSGHEYFVHFQNVTYLDFNINFDTLIFNDHCEEAVDLTCGQSYSNNFSLASKQTIDDVCGPSKEGFWYRYQGAEKYLEFKLTGPIYDVGLDIMDGDCDAAIATCLASPSLQKDDSYFFRAEQDVPYWIHVKDQYHTNTEYNLYFDCHDTSINTSCQQAFQLPNDTSFSSSFAFSEPKDYQFGPCNTYNGKLWYTFVGDGLVKQGHLSNGQLILLEGDCQNLSCLTSNSSSFNFKSEAGKTYYILLANYTTGNFNFSFQSFAPLPNDQREGAEQISCGFDQVISFEGATHDSTACFNHSNTRGLWYTLTGSDQLLSFSTLPNYADYQLSIFHRINDSLICLMARQVTRYSPAYYFGKLDSTYLINISEYFPSNDFTRVQVQCLEISENLICDRAEPLICNDTIFTTIEDQYDEPDACDLYNDDGGRWYYLNGTGEIIKFKLLRGNEFILSVMKGDCKTGQCILYDWVSNGDSILFHAEQGTVYFLKMDGYNSYDYEILVECLAPPPGEGCTNAQLLHYDEEVSFDPALYLPNITCSNYGYYNGIWYKFYSEHRTKSTLQILNNGSAYVSLIKNACGGECHTDLPYNYSSNSYEFETEAKTWYYISIEPQNYAAELSLILSDIPGSYISPCLETQTLSYTSLPNGDHLNGIIQAGSSINSFATLITGEANFIWQAPDSILMGSNFEVAPNAEFEIKIDDCQ